MQARLSVDTTSARVLESRSRSESIAQLQSVIDEATRRRYVTHALRTRLWQGAIALRAGDRERGRAQLAAVKSDAAARGFAAFAHRHDVQCRT